ncbi:uncharacterized protein LOC119466233 isoform X9 [Dermacentor silvarum]|uniref:uncharacterized protein LOC119466233 isoform X9 n=1 Tax=Dermacentor silvarum TaxID=543639 RepID=UPI002100FDFC|nr:uncharacterized protein LOC119466233 isoform X9 [Dermacentor silvarum]
MKHQVAAVFLILCFTSAAVNANAAVDAVIEELKDFVRHFEKDQAKVQEALSKIDRASECLSAAKDINPDIINQTKNCLLDKANNFKESSGMTPEEIKMFDDALTCIQKVAEE